MREMAFLLPDRESGPPNYTFPISVLIKCQVYAVLRYLNLLTWSGEIDPRGGSIQVVEARFVKLCPRYLLKPLSTDCSVLARDERYLTD